MTLKETRIDKEKRNICYRPVRGVYVCKQAWFMVLLLRQQCNALARMSRLG